MDSFERELALAMKRVHVRPEFSEKLLAVAAEEKRKASRGRVLMFPQARDWRFAALAAAMAVCVFGGDQVYQRHEREKAELVQRQFDTAMRVTDHALDQTRAQLEKAGLRLGD